MISPRMFQLKTPSGVVYNDESAFELKAGVYHRFEIQTNLKNISTVKKVTIDIGGTPITISTGEQLNVIQLFKGKKGKLGRIILDLSKFEYRTPRGIYKTGLAIGENENATLNIEFDKRDTSDSANQDPVTLTMRGKAWMTENNAADEVNSGRKFLPIRKTVTLNSADAGQHDWSFPGGFDTHVQRLLFDESNVKISQIIIKRGKTEISKVDRADIDFMLEDIADMTPQEGFLLLDFTLLGFGEADALNAAGLNFEIMTDSDGAIKTYIEGWEDA